MECHFEPLRSATSSAGQENGGWRPADRTPLFSTLSSAGCRGARKSLVAHTKKKNRDEAMVLDGPDANLDEDDESGTGGTAGVLPDMRPGARRALLSRFDAAPGEEHGEEVILHALKLNVREVYGHRRPRRFRPRPTLSAIERD